MIYFDCFDLVGRLEFNVCADKTSSRQHVFGRYDKASGFPFQYIFSGSDNQSQKFWDNSIKHSLLGSPLKKLKYSYIKTPSSFPICNINVVGQ